MRPRRWCSTLNCSNHDFCIIESYKFVIVVDDDGVYVYIIVVVAAAVVVVVMVVDDDRCIFYCFVYIYQHSDNKMTEIIVFDLFHNYLFDT